MKKKLKEIAKKLWDKTDGWKTVVGIVLHLVWGGVHIKYDIDPAYVWGLHGGIGNITGVGLGDKVRKYVKSPIGQKAIKTVSKLIIKK